LKTILFILCFLLNGKIFSQEIDSIFKKDSVQFHFIQHSFQPTGALVSYYFWEEDSNGYILNNEIKKPYLQNYFISVTEKNAEKHTVESEQLYAIISQFSHAKTAIKAKKSFELITKNKKVKVSYPLIREEAKEMGSVLFIKKNNHWESQRKATVNYFMVTEDNKWKYYFSSDSILLEKHKIQLPSNGQFIVISYLKKNGNIDKQVVYTYSGMDVTDYILETKTMLPQRVLVFANGYRGPTTNKDESDHLVTNKDRYHYWYKLDNQFIDRLKPSETYYIDGSMGINTSNHKSMFRFAISYFRSTFVFRKHWSKRKFKALNTTSNIEGFQTRKDRGRIAGKAFLTALCNSPACQNTKDTIDLVCHSMGYAYTLGFIEEIKQKVVFGKIYILAAENACIDGTDWTLFQEVWQYGSNLDQENPDPIWEQDGVAPQCQVKGLEVMKPDKGGRAFIPKDWPRKNFVDSHQPYNFDWIFERIQKGEAGYIYR
jgi:hypothetical protein